MTDDQTNPMPDDTGDDAPLGGVSESELDAMLTQAGELVDQLSTELGESDTAPATTTVEDHNDGPSVASSLEAELAHLNVLADTTTAEVIGTDEPTTQADPDNEFADLFPGGPPPPVPPDLLKQALTGSVPVKPAPTDPAAAQWPIEETREDGGDQKESPPPTTAASEPEPPTTRAIEETDTIPDFMKEFMEPEPEPEPKPEPEDTSDVGDIPTAPVLETHAKAMPVQTRPGVVGTGTLHQVVRREPATTGGANEQAPPPPAAPSSNPVLRLLRGMLIFVLQRIRNIGPVKPVLTRMGYWICDKTVFALEKIDAPLSSIGERIRLIVGWVAMATLGTSAIVYIISFF